jgi:hypothetical protein
MARELSTSGRAKMLSAAADVVGDVVGDVGIGRCAVIGGRGFSG